MRLLSLEITDFGPHRHLRADLNAPIVGLLGPNGAGKSVFLRSIRFALTGETTDKLDTYIRGRGVNVEQLETLPNAADLVAKKASVDLVFHKDDHTGRILRTILPSKTTRKLWWDSEKPLTKAGPVDALLADVMGADKKALAEIVFPEQGMLDRLLSGEPAEREELFVKLLLLTHCSKVSDFGDRKAQLILHEITDLTTQRDQLQELIDAQTSKVMELETTFRQCRSWAEELKAHRDVKHAKEVCAAQLQAVSEAKQDLADSEQQLAATLARLQTDVDGRPCTFTSVEQLENVVGEVKMQQSQLQTTASEQMRAKERQTRLEALQRELQNALAAYEEVSKEFAQLDAWHKKAAQAERLPQRLKALIEQQRERVRLVGQQEIYERSLPDVKEQLETHVAELPACIARAEALNTDCDTLVGDIAVAKIEAEALRMCLQHGAADCPVCHHDLGEVSAERVEACEAKVAALQRAHATAVQERAVRSKAASDHTAAIHTAKNEIARQEKELAAIEESIRQLPDEDLTTLQEELRQAEGYDYRHTQLVQMDAVAVAQKRVADVETDIAACPETMAFDAMVLEAANAVIDRCKRWLSPAEQTLQQLNRQAGEISRATAGVAAAKQKYEAAREALAQKQAARPQALVDILVQLPSERAEEVMEQREEDYRRADGALSQGRDQLRDLKKRMDHLRAREEADKQRRMLAAEMVQIKEAFARRGLPITYVQYLFEQLVVLANTNLITLGANFQVEVAPNAFVAMNFRRTDDDSDALFSMGKLSGGQQVRLSIAFLLAVQQLIIPDLGFLVLDEPSMHLNDEGVENLADLLQSLGSSLTASSAQIIVCDHNHKLERAFQKTIRL